MLGVATCLVIDEAQRMPETAQFVKGWHDAYTGKISYSWVHQVLISLIYAESLTGRNEKSISTTHVQEYLHAPRLVAKNSGPVYCFTLRSSTHILSIIPCSLWFLPRIE